MVGNSYPEPLISLLCNLLPLILLFSLLSVLPAIKDRRVSVCGWGDLMSSFRMMHGNQAKLSGASLGHPLKTKGWGGGDRGLLLMWAGTEGPKALQALETPKLNGFGWLETEQQPATTECFIAVWKCLFSEHKFKGQIQGMSRSKAYHHVSWADKDNLLYPAFVLGQSEEKRLLTSWNSRCSALPGPSLNSGMACINPLGASRAHPGKGHLFGPRAMCGMSSSYWQQQQALGALSGGPAQG